MGYWEFFAAIRQVAVGQARLSGAIMSRSKYYTKQNQDINVLKLQ